MKLIMRQQPIERGDDDFDQELELDLSGNKNTPSEQLEALDKYQDAEERRELRTEMIQHLDSFIKQMEKNSSESIEEVQKTITIIRKISEDIKRRTSVSLEELAQESRNSKNKNHVSKAKSSFRQKELTYEKEVTDGLVKRLEEYFAQRITKAMEFGTNHSYKAILDSEKSGSPITLEEIQNNSKLEIDYRHYSCSTLSINEYIEEAEKLGYMADREAFEILNYGEQITALKSLKDRLLAIDNGHYEIKA